MMAQELVLRQRADLLRVLCSSGSAERLECILDLLLAEGVLVWEDYQNVQVTGRALCSNARHLLDLVSTKGVDACQQFLSAFSKVVPEAHRLDLSVGERCGDLEAIRNPHGTASETLLTERPILVTKLRGCIDEALRVLLETGSITATDCDEVQLPVYGPSQQARHLLDHVRSKGESAAKVLLQYVERREGQESPTHQEKCTLPKEYLQYQKKLRSSVSGQSRFLSTYGGTNNLSLDEIYTDSQLELSQDCTNAQGPLGLEDIVGEIGTVNEEADTVLVSGVAGSGKSTLLQRLHLLWASGTALHDFLFLFPFSCRKLSSECRELSIQELLFEHCCWPDRGQEQLLQFILDHPHLVLFTFDGLDELKQCFSDERRHCSPKQRAPVPILLFNLFQGSLMKGVRKVLTSRPEAVCMTLKRCLRKEVFLKGFSPSGIDCFVRKHHCDPTVAVKVLEALQSNTALLGLCHIPVFCWIVSKCYKELLGHGENGPQTTTDVYLMILQHFFQHQKPQENTARRGWVQGHIGTALHLGHLAFSGIQASCYVFSDTELQMCGVSEEDINMGFLIHSKNLSATSCKQYEFLHMTLQCFFAALYIVLSNDVDCSIISKVFQLQHVHTVSEGRACFGSCLSTATKERASEKEGFADERSNLQITATFVAGLLSKPHQNLLLQCCPGLNLDNKGRQVFKSLSKGIQKHFKSIPQPVEGETKSMHAMPGFIWLMKCIYEMQDTKLAKNNIAKLDVEHLKLTYCQIGPVECTALAFTLQHLKKPVGIQLDNNSVGDVGVEQLLPCMHMCNSLHLRNNNISDEGIRKLIAKGITCESFQKIALFNNNLTDACTQHFSHLLKNKQNFIALRLGNNNITAEGAKHLAEGLRFNRSLQYLGLWGNTVGDTGAEALASALKDSKTLVWFSLVGNGVGNSGACALAQVIKSCHSLKELWLSNNSITRSGVECLIQALEHNTSIKSLWLRSNELSQDEMEEMTQRESRLTF